SCGRYLRHLVKVRRPGLQSGHMRTRRALATVPDDPAPRVRAPYAASANVGREQEIQAFTQAPGKRMPAVAQAVLANAALASARIRSTMARNPFERCGVRWSRSPMRSNRATASVASISRAGLPE